MATWRIVSRNSLWSKLLQQKYDVISNSIQLRQNYSRLWKAFYPHFHNLQHLCYRCVGRGDITGRQIGWGKFLDRSSLSQLTVREGIQKLNSIRDGLIESQLEKIQAVVLDVTEEDRLIFSPSLHGKFQVSTYLKQIVAVRPHVPWTDII